MLAKIEISNFKNFKENFVFDLSKANSFAFNKECVKNNIVNKAIVYGHNGSGKSNLGFAIFDLISHLTDKRTEPSYYKNYFNADLNSNIAKFNFEFIFDDNIVEYRYTKSDNKTLVSEELIINNNEYFHINKVQSSIFRTTAKGAENLKKDLGESNISIVNYLSKNTILENNKENRIFEEFKKFVNKMLYFRVLDDKSYMGLEQTNHIIEHDIVERNNLADFEQFLNDAGIVCNLISKKDSFNKNNIFMKFQNRELEFFEVASSGTKSLALFYFWYQRLKEENSVSFLFIDEFDAFYHHSLSKTLVEKLKELIDVQVVLTTHNTSIISNELLRPDCYFLMYPNKITSLSKSTTKELREAHNIEKMYRAGFFE